MKERYIKLMEMALSAYSDEHIVRYFNDVKANGLTEHGFARLTSNIGILIAHDRRRDLLQLFLEMMDFCCQTIPTVKAANDFSVREIICCLWEIERSGAVAKEITEGWRRELAGIEHATCYNAYAVTPTDTVRNWALFTAVSEYFRGKAGLCEVSDFVDLQLLQQLQWLDENGMYRDSGRSKNQQPIMYDLVPRGLFSVLLDQGYRGGHYDVIDAMLKKAGLLTLQMQSPNGEMAFGGRSNQFLHNEAWLCCVYEYEAKRYAREGNTALVDTFKSAIVRAIGVVEEWLSRTPITHIKNRFPTETKFGCEPYAYFDKYMITVASFLYMAYQICDDSVSFTYVPDITPCVAATSAHFHKLFVKSGGYGLEFDTDADPHYDANGLGRIHRLGAPSAVCLSCPCPAKPIYEVDVSEPMALSACSAIRTEGEWRLGAETGSRYEVVECREGTESASAVLLCRFDGGKTLTEHYTVNARGVEITVEGDGEIGFVLPAFCFDGECSAQVTAEKHALTVSYAGWICRYTTDGTVLDTGKVAANRNGHYRAYLATGAGTLHVYIEIVKA
ncbi:MAG: hypothetical protein IJX80_04770 [Clostridia bacterium]|nr:hypothetical protein [Clostridia bacterium]